MILDAGAADGADTIRFAKMLPNASIYALEPVAVNYHILEQQVSKYRNVKIFKMALADYNGECEMNISENTNQPGSPATSSSLLAPQEHLKVHPHITFSKKEVVPTITLDEWAKKENIDHIDVLWLDMQGMEYRVLKSSTEMIHTVQVIYTEVSLMEMYENSILYDDYKKWLNSMGFEVAKEELLWKDMGNVLFVRKNYVG
ncbi:MAG: FkbM family methyltransferase [Tannerellaceae bacterium]|nr:FkbM family methyltransferase [Tannerellaceae bacterium]